ncbi:MAG TPA: hypothetical protein VH370_07170 [Humisphaera sp.]|jgi:hypothetical protein|nr:hypothetical protein [Humisphaera sp.]
MPDESPAVPALVPLCSVPYDPTWPKPTRLHWIVDTASWWRDEIPRALALKDNTNFEVQLRMKWLRNAVQGVTTLWTAACRELPPVVTKPLNALRDGFNAPLSDDQTSALLADLIAVEDEARRRVDDDDAGEPAVQIADAFVVAQRPVENGRPEPVTGMENMDSPTQSPVTNNYFNGPVQTGAIGAGNVVGTANLVQIADPKPAPKEAKRWWEKIPKWIKWTAGVLCAIALLLGAALKVKRAWQDLSPASPSSQPASAPATRISP